MIGIVSYASGEECFIKLSFKVFKASFLSALIEFDFAVAVMANTQIIDLINDILSLSNRDEIQQYFELPPNYFPARFNFWKYDLHSSIIQF